MISKSLRIKQDASVVDKFSSYPSGIREKMENLRRLIIDVARENESIEELEETLKWGEPSYIAKKGSTIRIDWKPRSPDQYAMYFKCTSKLVPTFKKLYGSTFAYEKNRAILFSMDGKIPIKELKHCIELALNYHVLKNQDPFV